MKKPVIFRISVIIILLLLAVTPFMDATPAAAQSVSISAVSGQPGTSITISGNGFNAGDTYQIIFAPGTAYEELLAPVTTTNGTGFTRVVVVPHAPYNQYDIRVASNRGNFSLLFRILPVVELNSISGYAGDTLLVSGAGFNANRSVNIFFNNSLAATTISNSRGTLNAAGFQVPAATGRSYDIYANDGTVSSPSVVFTIRPHLTASLSQGFVGDQLELNGTGFDDNSAITIYWDNAIIGPPGINTNGSGSFTATITVPPDTRGNHSIRARDGASGSETIYFLINPKLTINPSGGTSGGIITITGTGFRANAPIDIAYDGAAIPGQPGFTTDSSGSFSGSLVLPNVLAGNYTLRASDGIYSATTLLTISSKIELSVSTGNIGMEVLLYGTGFTPGGEIVISYDNQAVLNLDADSAGSFSGSFNIPASGSGQHNITARDITTGSISATAVFTMESVPPATPGLLTPQNGIQTGLRPVFNWSAVTDPSGVAYDLQVATDANFTQLVIYKQGLTSPQYQVEEQEELRLTKNTSPYYWRVRAVDAAGNASEWAGPNTFYTQDSTPPSIPATFSPQDGSQAEPGPVFSWSEASDPGAVTYDLQVATDADFTQLVIFKQGLNLTEYRTTESEDLQPAKKDNPYYWRVRAVDTAGNASGWAGPNTFYTQDSTPPPVPAPLKPENGSTQSGNAIFDWTDVSDPGGVTYILQVAQDESFSRLLIYKEGLSISEYQPAAAEELIPTTGEEATPYYWRVRAVDSAQNPSDWSISNAFYVRGSGIRGWAWAALGVIGGILLLGIGVLIGMRVIPGKKHQG